MIWRYTGSIHWSDQGKSAHWTEKPVLQHVTAGAAREQCMPHFPLNHKQLSNNHPCPCAAALAKPEPTKAMQTAGAPNGGTPHYVCNVYGGNVFSKVPANPS